MQVCTALQTVNHTSTPPLSFLQAGCPSCCPTNSVKALKAILYYNLWLKITAYVVLRENLKRILFAVQWKDKKASRWSPVGHSWQTFGAEAVRVHDEETGTAVSVSLLVLLVRVSVSLLIQCNIDDRYYQNLIKWGLADDIFAISSLSELCKNDTTTGFN